MKPFPAIKAYAFSDDIGINASITMLRVNKRLRLRTPGYKPTSFYQKRIKNKRAARRFGTRIVR